MSRKSDALKRDIEVLGKFALKEDYYISELGEATGRDDHTARRRLNVLENQNYIEFIGTQPTDRGSGKPRKLYKITFLGLFILLETKKEIWKHIEQIASIHKDMFPLIFGKMDFFEENGIKEEIMRRFKAAFQVTKTHILDLKKGLEINIDYDDINNDTGRRIAKKFDIHYERAFKKGLEDLKDALVNFTIIGIPEKGVIKQDQKRLSILKKDKELENYIDKHFRTKLSQYIQYSENLTEWIKWWDSIK